MFDPLPPAQHWGPPSHLASNSWPHLTPFRGMASEKLDRSLRDVLSLSVCSPRPVLLCFSLSLCVSRSLCLTVFFWILSQRLSICLSRSLSLTLCFLLPLREDGAHKNWDVERGVGGQRELLSKSDSGGRKERTHTHIHSKWRSDLKLLGCDLYVVL